MAWSIPAISGRTPPRQPWPSGNSIPIRCGRKRTGRSSPPTRTRSSELPSQHAQQLFELHAHLLDDLLALADVHARFFTRELVARAADGEALLVEQRADLPDDDDVLALVVAAVAATLDRLELRKFL